MSVEEKFIEILRDTGLDVSEAGKWRFIESTTWVSKKRLTKILHANLPKLALSKDEIKNILGRWGISDELGLRYKLANAIYSAQPLVGGSRR